MRFSAPVRLAPPSPGPVGCLMCGVGVVQVPATEVARRGHAVVLGQSWRATRTSVTALGRGSPRRLSGHLCPPRADAFEAVGAMGQTAMTRALLAWLRSSGAERVARAAETQAEQMRFPGWGALGGRPDSQRAPLGASRSFGAVVDRLAFLSLRLS